MSSHPHSHSVEQSVEKSLAQEANIYTLAPPILSTSDLPIHPSTTTALAPAPATDDMNTLHPNPTEGTLPSGTATIVNSRPASIKDVHESPISRQGELEKAHSHASDPEQIPTEKDVAAAPEVDRSGLLTGAKLYLVFLSMMLSVFMFALDQSIVSTAIPEIVSSFQAFDQVAWIITGYFLTQCGLILLVGQLLTVLKAKWMLLGAIFFFELGSLLCGVANGMPLLIFGRAVQGVGASGMFVSILAVIATITTLEQRPAFMAAFGIVFVISSVIGPLLGGVFTERVSWRWCFYINLPIGGIAAAAVVFLLPATEPKVDGTEDRPKGWKGLAQLDYLGALLILVFVTCLLLALQWGGNDYAWNNWRIIFLLCLSVVLIPVFFLWQWKLDRRALIPLSLLKNRTQVAASGAMFFFMMGMLGGTYQLPLYYQVGRDHSPQQSGIDIIPFMLATCIAIFIAGGGTTATGRYWPFIVAGPPIAAVGFGLLYTIDAYTANAKIIGFQILAGFGIGLSFQNALIAIQAEYNDRPHLIPQATSVVSFFQLTGASVGTAIVNVVLSESLVKNLRRLAPNAPFELVRQSTVAVYSLPEDQRPPIIEAYVIAITDSLLPLIAAMGLALLFGAFIRNISMKGKKIEAAAA